MVKSALIVVGLEINGVSDQTKLSRLDTLTWFVNELVAFGCRKHQGEGLVPFDKIFFIVRCAGPKYSDYLRRDRFYKDTYVMETDFLTSTLEDWVDRYRQEIKELGSRLRSDGIEQVAVCGLPTSEMLVELRLAGLNPHLIEDENAICMTDEERRSLLTFTDSVGIQSISKYDIFQNWCHKSPWY